MAECPWEALRDRRLPDGSKTLLTVLWKVPARRAREEVGLRVVAMNPDLHADLAGMQPRTYRRHMAELRHQGWVTVNGARAEIALWREPRPQRAHATPDRSLSDLLREVASRLEGSDG